MSNSDQYIVRALRRCVNVCRLFGFGHTIQIGTVPRLVYLDEDGSKFLFLGTNVCKPDSHRSSHLGYKAYFAPMIGVHEWVEYDAIRTWPMNKHGILTDRFMDENGYECRLDKTHSN